MAGLFGCHLCQAVASEYGTKLQDCPIEAWAAWGQSQSFVFESRVVSWSLQCGFALHQACFHLPYNSRAAWHFQKWLRGCHLIACWPFGRFHRLHSAAGYPRNTNLVLQKVIFYKIIGLSKGPFSFFNSCSRLLKQIQANTDSGEVLHYVIVISDALRDTMFCRGLALLHIARQRQSQNEDLIGPNGMTACYIPSLFTRHFLDLFPTLFFPRLLICALVIAMLCPLHPCFLV